MKSIKTEIIINASRGKVWKTLMNHADFPNWNPFIKEISGFAEVGGYLKVTIQNQGKSPMEFTPVVLVNKWNKEFRWKGKLFLPGLFDGEHYFVLDEIGPGRTRLIHGENFSGVLSGIILKMIGEETIQGFEAMNEALKNKVEVA